MIVSKKIFPSLFVILGILAFLFTTGMESIKILYHHSIINRQGMHTLNFYYLMAATVLARLLVCSTFVAAIVVCSFKIRWIPFSILACVLLFEGTIFFLIKHPRFVGERDWLSENAKEMHFKYHARFTQSDEKCTEYNDRLTYMFIPGTCRFENIEFKTTLKINSKGLRDDEDSLNQPQIIALGDSFTMGWGIEQEETFAQLLEKNSKKKTLNAGIASFGTVREFKLLNELDTSALEYLIIQYHDNDVTENLEYYSSGQLKISSKEKYLSWVAKDVKERRYFPLIYTFTKIKSWLGKIEFKETDFESKNAALDDVDIFMNVLNRSLNQKSEYAHLKIIVLYTPYFDHSTFFDKRLKERLKNENSLKNITVIEAMPLLEHRSLYYPLDSHLNAKGHRVLAEALMSEMKSS